MTNFLSGMIGLFLGYGCWVWMASKKNQDLKIFLQSNSTAKPAAKKHYRILEYLKNKNRNRLVLQDLPDFLDIFAMTSGVCGGFEAAFNTALQLVPRGPLRADLEILDRKVTLGQTRERALEEFINGATNLNVQCIFKVIKTAAHHGSPLAEVIRAQAASLREDRLMQLEKEAHTAGLKLLVPILLFIFPTIFLLLFGGIWLNAQSTGSLFF